MRQPSGAGVSEVLWEAQSCRSCGDRLAACRRGAGILARRRLRASVHFARDSQELTERSTYLGLLCSRQPGAPSPARPPPAQDSQRQASSATGGGGLPLNYIVTQASRDSRREASLGKFISPPKPSSSPPSPCWSYPLKAQEKVQQVPDACFVLKEGLKGGGGGSVSEAPSNFLFQALRAQARVSWGGSRRGGGACHWSSGGDPRRCVVQKSGGHCTAGQAVSGVSCPRTPSS